MKQKKGNTNEVAATETQPEPVSELQQTTTNEPEPAVVAAAQVQEPVAVPVLETEYMTVEDVLNLQAKLASVRQSAIMTLLSQIETAKKKLAQLGYEDEDEPDVPNSIRPNVRKPAATKAGTAVPFCKLCNVDGHDGRAHRSQAVKKAFTAKEQAEMFS